MVHLRRQPASTELLLEEAVGSEEGAALRTALERNAVLGHMDDETLRVGLEERSVVGRKALPQTDADGEPGNGRAVLRDRQLDGSPHRGDPSTSSSAPGATLYFEVERLGLT